jgi:hypothetical protein
VCFGTYYGFPACLVRYRTHFGGGPITPEMEIRAKSYGNQQLL